MKTVSEAIAAACLVGEPFTKERLKALRAVRWVLRSGSMFIGPVDAVTLETPLVADRGKALVFDGRDNEQTRADYFGRVFGAPFVAELLIA